MNKMNPQYKPEQREEDRLLNTMASDIKYIRRDLDKIALDLEKDYITKDQFEPVRRLVYGLVSIILVAVVGAIVALVLP